MQVLCTIVLASLVFCVKRLIRSWKSALIDCCFCGSLKCTKSSIMRAWDCCPSLSKISKCWLYFSPSNVGSSATTLALLVGGNSCGNATCLLVVSTLFLDPLGFLSVLCFYISDRWPFSDGLLETHLQFLHLLHILLPIRFLLHGIYQSQRAWMICCVWSSRVPCN